MKPTTDFEVIIIGGSYSGLSAAMALGRSLRNTLIIDAGKPCNRQTPHSHNFLTQDGSTPQEIAEIARNQVAKYDTVEFYDGMAVGSKKVENGFDITTSRGETFHTKKLLLATGIKDLMPNIEGFAECWGISVVHCPYCHGYEIRNQKTAIMANGDTAVHLASLVNNLTKDLTILTEGKIPFDDEQLDKLFKQNIKIIEKEIVAIDHKAGYLKSIRFKDGSVEAFDAAYASIPFEQNTLIPEELGCKLTEQGYIEVDEMGKTTEDGVFACGDCSTMMRSVATAVYKGNIAGVFINHELTQESF
ncbi:NAD(P)/FAD-dependent oxidoreductase [Cyclobacterium sp. 1_MG-2023]|uniref:NAD(P)/FAD-dependent oxidoreductase n=1 Tax=Cyclobacterium sp. 1_MG-2023 TaxID=3062681 RepID=UPI0026E202A5|nr:NAD(P)/FAD-dependent oxidoreductase [Cyclobacterium sp. 1_MG-2023]MDO6439137.1 NAD(P)/FAD-dependent oxidoreductase [Cyclobacterium sp. 1_MG-2023]